MPALFRGQIFERRVLYGPDTTKHCFRGRRPQPLSGRNPPFSDASAAGRVHARQAVSGA
ncbi:MAG TPA: hypothetical protein VGX71_02225 [Pseudaminobacter sp.]|nr:hypothetical protein [Pseudaminobacter sp.]